VCVFCFCSAVDVEECFRRSLRSSSGIEVEEGTDMESG
jgi:hypothetical protein